MFPLLLVSGIGLILSVFVGLLFLAMFAASAPVDARARPRVQPPEASAARQQETLGPLNPRPPAALRPPPSGGSSRAGY